MIFTIFADPVYRTSAMTHHDNGAGTEQTRSYSCGKECQKLKYFRHISLLCSCDLDLDHWSSYTNLTWRIPRKMQLICEYELLTSRLSSVIVWQTDRQTDRQTRPIITTPLRGWSKIEANVVVSACIVRYVVVACWFLCNYFYILFPRRACFSWLC